METHRFLIDFGRPRGAPTTKRRNPRNIKAVRRDSVCKTSALLHVSAYHSRLLHAAAQHVSSACAPQRDTLIRRRPFLSDSGGRSSGKGCFDNLKNKSVLMFAPALGTRVKLIVLCVCLCGSGCLGLMMGWGSSFWRRNEFQICSVRRWWWWW